MSQLRWNVVFQQGEKWIRLEKTYYKVFKNAQTKADEWQKACPNLVVRVRQYPEVKIENGVHVLFDKPLFPGKKLAETKRLDPVQRVPHIQTNDLMPADLTLINGSQIREYWESAQWHKGEILVSWNGDDTGYSTHREDRHGNRISQDVSFKVGKQSQHTNRD